MRGKYSLEKTLSVEIKINEKHFDLIVTNKDLTDIITRAVLTDTGLHASLDLMELLTRTDLATLDIKDGLYYRLDKLMTVVTVEDILHGVFDIVLNNVSYWDKADSEHIPTYKSKGTIYGMIAVSNLTDKGLSEIIKAAVKNALRENSILDEKS